ncbi:MAG: 1-acyl-sn-glycerol-3-phosphate acyltransferase [Deltaproteobacteria bacterium]|jgi:1-acyl-sn-glycerol-3-phosphate acyltransferase|nr:1-acyl-sn-glycerol-3-phosphate acyltransferase [Deltaproteobacteria bacterium]
MEILAGIRLAAGFYCCFLAYTGAALLLSPLVYAFFRCGKRLPGPVAARSIMWWYGRGWTRIFRLFARVTVVGCETPLPRPCIITANHQSFFDAYCIGFLPVQNLVFLVRRWPFGIPFYGLFMRKAGYINTEDADGEAILRQSREALASGASLVVFPEGTRSRTGKLGRFHGGAFLLAVARNVPVVPFCLDGTGAFLRPGECIPRKADVRVTALPPVYPEAFAPHGEAAHMAMRREVKRRMNEILVSRR